MTSLTNEKFYSLAYQFLLENKPTEISAHELTQYLVPEKTDFSQNLNDLLLRLLISAQNANMKASVIGKSIGGVESLSNVLYKFDAAKILESYKNQPQKLLETIIREVKPNGKVRTTPQSIWPKYCKTILSCAEFINQFEASQDFFKWANHFYTDSHSSAALPLVLAAEIYGIAFPLACDFLKEIGFTNYGKPDVHIREILVGAGIVAEKTSDYNLLRSILQIAEESKKTAYEVDKVLWLIGSGFFYNHPDLGTNGRVRSMKKEFITSLITT